MEAESDQILGTFENIQSDQIEIEHTGGCNEALCSLPSEIWMLILGHLMDVPVDGSANLPEYQTQVRGVRSGLHARRAGQSIRVVDYVATDDRQVTRTQYSVEDDLNLNQALRSLRGSVVIPSNPDENYIHDLERNSIGSRLPDDKTALRQTIIGHRYDTANLRKSLAAIASVAATCKGFHLIMQGCIPRIVHFKSKKDYLTIQENAVQFKGVAMRGNGTVLVNPDALDTLWKGQTNYTKLALVRRRLLKVQEGQMCFVLESLPMWLIKERIRGFGVQLKVTQQANCECERVSVIRRTSWTDGCKSKSRRSYESSTAPVNGKTCPNRLLTMPPSHNKFPHITHMMQSDYLPCVDFESSIVSGMHIIDPMFLSSIMWTSNISSWNELIVAPSPSGSKKRGRPVTKEKFMYALLPHSLEIDIYAKYHDQKCGTIRPRPFYALGKKPNQFRATFGLETSTYNQTA